MASRPSQPPQRIPPSPSEPVNRSSEPVRPSPPRVWQRPSVASDGLELQGHVDRLSQEFDHLKAQLRQAQKLASIGTTAAMIAHEFNNLLTPVVAYARQALDSDDTELMRKALSKTLERTAMLREMADRVVGLAKQGDGAIKAVKVAQLVDNAIGCLGRDLARDNIGVNLQIDSELAVRANENQLLQVLFNLVINARQAMLGKRGRLSVDAAPTREGTVKINVRDTGCGISAENLPKIFEPFFSTKQHSAQPEARGLGLGLSICQDIITQLGGQIEVTSELGTGTTFTIVLPQAD
jgi:signal transduction histidine kinase